MTILIPILGDQLSPGLSSLKGVAKAEAVLLLMEVAEETRYVRHHKAKIAFLFAAMRHHGRALAQAGWRVDYVRLDDPDNAGSLTGEVARAIARHGAERIIVTEAGEWRVQAMLESWETLFGLPMNGDRPEGDRWNFDKENRKPAKADLLMPRPLSFVPDTVTREVIDLVTARFADHPGSLDAFDYAVTAEQAGRQAAHFFRHALHDFGAYEDAMLTGERFLWHSILSPYINVGLLDPLDLCRRAEAEYRAGRAPLNSVEGYIRQIVGWREYVRGIYWREGPDYARRNHLGAHRRLPAFYWTAETDMHCLAEAIGQTLATGHAHHIQRLMVTGNFALLIGADPHAVHLWYLEIYVDAYEWVELPNTLGMSQYGDGGLLGSKPYAASGAYIDRMSDYCRHCRYDVTRRTGDDACPFNALYWDFLARHEQRLKGNRRMTMPYRTWARFPAAEQEAIRARAKQLLARFEEAAGNY